MVDTVFVVSAGRTDLQVLVEDSSGTFHRAELGNNLRLFHQALLDGQLSYVVDARYSSTGKHKTQKIAKGTDVRWNEELSAPEIDPSYRIVRRDGAVVLVPDKLAEIVESLRRGHNVVGVVVLNTHRSETARNNPDLLRFWPDEPIACGPALSRWMADVFGLEPGSKPGDIGLRKAGWVNFLDDEMTTSGTGRDYPHNREAVRRIDEAMVQFGETDTGTIGSSYLEVCTSVGGGMPEYKDIIKACARYRFGYRQVRNWQSFENSRKESWVSAERERPTAAESFRIRERAAYLISERGDFAAAHAMAWQLFEEDREEKRWVKILEYATRYLAGTLAPDEHLPDYLKKLVQRDMPRCLLVGMRVEAALWGRRVPEAIAWTCAFFDAALLDSIEHIKGVEKLDDINKTITFKQGFQPKDLLTDKDKTNKHGLKKLKKPNRYKYLPGSSFDHFWLEVVGISALKNYAEELQKPCYPYRSKKVSLKNLRNLNMHSLIEQGNMDQARSAFENSGMWASKPVTSKRGPTQGIFSDLSDMELSRLGIPVTPYRYYFLGQPKVQNILKSLGVAEPGRLYSDLVVGVCKDMAEYVIT